MKVERRIKEEPIKLAQYLGGEKQRYEPIEIFLRREIVLKCGLRNKRGVL